MKPVADAKKPSSVSNLTNDIAPAQTGCTTKSNMFFSLLPAVCCALMLYSSVTAIVDSHGDPSTVFFVVSSLSILGLLYLSMREFERAVAVKDDRKRDRLKKAIWSLAVLLNILFSYRVTSVFFVVSSLSILGLLYLSMMTEITNSAFEPSSMMAKCDPRHGKSMMTEITNSAFEPSSMRPSSMITNSAFEPSPLATHLNLLSSYVVTSVLQSPVMTGVIWGIAAVTCLPHAESTLLPIEASSATDIHPQLLSSPFIATVVFLVIASLFCTLALVYMIRKLETSPDFFMRDPFNLKVAKCIIIVFLGLTFVCLCFTNTGDGSEITIFSVPTLLTSLCTYHPSSVLQVGVMAAAASTIAYLSWYWELTSANKIQPPSASDSEIHPSSYLFSAMKPVAEAKKPTSGSNHSTDGVAPAPAGCTTNSNMFFSLLPAACCAFMLYSSFTAIVDSHGDPSTVFFVVSSLSILGLLYLSMLEFETAVAVKDHQKRDRLKTAIWTSLAVLLNLLFSYLVTSVLNSPVMTGIVWGIAVVTSLVGIYLLFFLPPPPPSADKLQPPPCSDPESGKP